MAEALSDLELMISNCRAYNAAFDNMWVGCPAPLQRPLTRRLRCRFKGILEIGLGFYHSLLNECVTGKKSALLQADAAPFLERLDPEKIIQRFLSDVSGEPKFVSVCARTVMRLRC